MTAMQRTHFTWSGWSGAPGHTSLYFGGAQDAQAIATAAATFMFNATHAAGGASTYLPTNVKITQDPFVDSLEDSTGDQTGRTGVQPGAVITGLNNLNWAAAVGSAVTWSTNNFIKGRRLRGRTFFVPLSGACYETDGSLAAAYLTDLGVACNELINSPAFFVVWHRPTTKGGSDGSSSEAVAFGVSDKSAVLRSRRD